MRSLFYGSSTLSGGALVWRREWLGVELDQKTASLRVIYVAEEVTEFVSDYLSGVEPIGHPKSRRACTLQGVGTIGFKFTNTSYMYMNRDKGHTRRQATP